MTKASVEHASFTIERVFKASPARVFQAFADPAAHDRWFVKADNWPVAEYSHDFRVGGRDGKTFYFNETVYLDIVENRRIISAYTMAKDDRRISASIATVDLIPEGAGTRVVFAEQAAFLDGLDKVEYRRDGWEQLIGALAAERKVRRGLRSGRHLKGKGGVSSCAAEAGASSPDRSCPSPRSRAAPSSFIRIRPPRLETIPAADERKSARGFRRASSQAPPTG